nr:hypothetical protein [Tanacetum cinerariifolium]
DAIPLAIKSPRIVEWKIHKEGKKSYYQIVSADRKSQMYMIFITTAGTRVKTVCESYYCEYKEVTVSQVEKRRKHFAAKRAEEKRNKPPTKAQQRKIMCTYLKSMEGYKLKDLKLKEFNRIQEMFDRAFRRVNTFEDFKTELVKGKEKRA